MPVKRKRRRPMPKNGLSERGGGYRKTKRQAAIEKMENRAVAPEIGLLPGG